MKPADGGAERRFPRVRHVGDRKSAGQLNDRGREFRFAKALGERLENRGWSCCGGKPAKHGVDDGSAGQQAALRLEPLHDVCVQGLQFGKLQLLDTDAHRDAEHREHRAGGPLRRRADEQQRQQAEKSADAVQQNDDLAW